MEQSNNVTIGGKVINKESVLRVIRDASEYNYAVTKTLILNELGVKEDKFAMKALTILLKQMCKEELIDLVWTYNANKDYKLSGKGYVIHEDYQI